MDIKKLTLDTSIFKKVSELDNQKIKEVEALNKKHTLSIYWYIRTYVKRFVIDIINKFLKEKINYNRDRSLEQIKKKYNEIALNTNDVNSYVRIYEEEKEFIAYNNFDKKLYIVKSRSTDHPSNIIYKFCDHYDLKSIIEVGVGEFTLLLPIVKKSKKINFISGLDLSYERVKSGKAFFEKHNINANHYIVCDASNLPYADNSFDMVYTHYCLEQVPFLAKKIIDEMIRISSKYIIVMEPSYKFSNKITRHRILTKGFPILNQSHFRNKESKIIYRNGIPFNRYDLYGEITVLEKLKKSEGVPILRDPLTKKNISLNGNEILNFTKI